MHASNWVGDSLYYYTVLVMQVANALARTNYTQLPLNILD